ncbi:cyclic AMP receptor-like protein A [Sycon ciliatum]|uniref:cyclic AMP receptor-like protein A n=1 Tax=Sycon ciliatum TaxID=27933 RepID=UPI0031F6A46A
MNNTTTTTSCQPFPAEPHRCTVILNIRHAMASISLISCIFCLFIIWVFRKYENFAQRLIAWLTIAALFDSIAYVMGDLQDSVTPFCRAQAFFLSYFDWASLLWVCCITFNLYWNVIHFKATKSFEIVYHIICWVIPLIVASIPFAKSDGYGPAGLWCWITNKYTVMRFLLWYVPVWIAAVGLAIVYIYIRWKLKQQVGSWEGTYTPENQRMKELLREDISDLKYYPLVYLIISLFPTINRIQNAVTPGESYVYPLLILHTLFSPLQGFLNAIVFTFDKDTRSRLALHQLWAALRSRFSERHSVKPYSVGSSAPPANERSLLHESAASSVSPVSSGDDTGT